MKYYISMNKAVFYYCIGTKEKRIKLFLEQVLKREIIKVEIKNVKLLKDYINSKEKIIDYLVLTDIGYINVEINNNKESWIMERNISYACKIVTNSIKKGEDYYDAIKVIQINLNRLGKTEEGIVEYALRLDKKVKGYKKELSDIIKIYMVNIDYYKEIYKRKDKKLIKENSMICMLDLKEEEIECEGNEIIMGYKKDLERINDDEDFVKWMSYEEEEKKIKNTIKKIGENEGIKKGKLEIVKNMLKENFEISRISKVTGLSEKQIKSLI